MNSKESVADVIEEEDEDEVLENENNVNGSDVNASGSIQRVIRRVDSSSNQGLTNSEGSEDEDTVKSTARQSQLSGYKVYAFSTPLKRIFNFKLDINQANIQKNRHILF